MPAGSSYSLLLSVRFLIAVVGCLGFINLYAQRINLSLAMVCMTDQRIAVDSNSSTETAACVQRNSSEFIEKKGEFDWNKMKQNSILGSFFYGYLVTQVPGGFLAYKFGGKRIFGYSMLLGAVCTLLMPLGARLNSWILMGLRVLVGLCQGVVWPATHALWSRWAPPHERSILLGITFAGSQIGNVVTLPLAGLLCSVSLDNGWPLIFYTIGASGVAWFVLWTILVADRPREHKFIHKAELAYIEEHVGEDESGKASNDDRIPWLKFFTSLPLWGIIFAHFCANWGSYSFLTNMPSYLSEIMFFDIKSNSFISSIAYFGFWLTIICSGFAAKVIISKRLLNLTRTRKLFNSLGLFGPVVFLLLLTSLDCNSWRMITVCLVVGVSCSGFQYSSGFVVNHADIAPHYAGILFGITNTFATIPGFVAPIVIGKMTKNKTAAEWKNFFYLTCAIYVLGGVIFLALGSGEIQSWARRRDEDNRSANTTQISMIDWQKDGQLTTEGKSKSADSEGSLNMSRVM